MPCIIFFLTDRQTDGQTDGRTDRQTIAMSEKWLYEVRVWNLFRGSCFRELWPPSGPIKDVLRGTFGWSGQGIPLVPEIQSHAQVIRERDQEREREGISGREVSKKNKTNFLGPEHMLASDLIKLSVIKKSPPMSSIFAIKWSPFSGHFVCQMSKALRSWPAGVFLHPAVGWGWGWWRN